MYKPSQEILDKYADVLVNFALGSGKGIEKGEVVLLQVPECAKPMLLSLQKAVLKAGGHYIVNYLPDETARNFYELAEDHQLEFFPEKMLRGRVEEMDHMIHIEATTNLKELEGIHPAKILKKDKSHGLYRVWREQKENEGKFTWCIALYGTQQMADEAELSIEEYWGQIIKACYLDKKNPVEEWKKAFDEIERVLGVLNSMKIEKLHVKSKNVDLSVGIGKNRKWLGGSGRNIPSFEIFISPDWRGTNGKVSFDQPLYRYGNLIDGIILEFKDGKIINSSANKGEEILKEMIATENADKIGEFSLTDSRLSKIDKFMAETLFDENFGGKFGNFHIALGSAYKDSYPGDASRVSKEEWERMGFNESVVHTDIVSSYDREVNVYLEDGSKKLIYKEGKFVI